MATRKKQVTKKQAATGRPQYHAKCMSRTYRQLTFDGHDSVICPKCGVLWTEQGGQNVETENT